MPIAHLDTAEKAAKPQLRSRGSAARHWLTNMPDELEPGVEPVAMETEEADKSEDQPSEPKDAAHAAEEEPSEAPPEKVSVGVALRNA